MARLSRQFFARDTAKVARDLIGKAIVKSKSSSGGDLRGEIVETEAYYGEEDPPSHASAGRTERSGIMWEKPGQVYVYLVYGIYYMFNIVTQREGVPGAVLIRGLEPLAGLGEMRARREDPGDEELTSGPGKWTQAFGIDLEENGLDVVTSELIWVEEGLTVPEERIGTSGRIGVSEGEEARLRFYLEDNRFVSK